MYGYPLGMVKEKEMVLLTGMQILQGAPVNIKKYIAILRKSKQIKRLEVIADNAFFYETSINANLNYYQNLYTQQIFYVSPIVHQQGNEMFNIASWRRDLLENIIKNVQQNSNTRYFKLLFLRKMHTKKLFIPQILPTLTEKQRRALSLAKERGYWNYPKEVNLDKLARELKVAKSTAHEILRRAEARLLDYFI